MPRSILHVDMDQFYAAVEMHRRPELKGKPVIIGMDPQGGQARGVVSTASYEARAFGVRSAMPISTAWKLCPQGVFLPVDFPAYIAVSEQIHQVFESLTPEVEPLSLDEAFLDVSASGLLFGDGEACARRVKDEILRVTGLTCSVGVAANKFVAKVASELRKPDGLVIVPAGTEQAFLAPLAIGRLWGVGKVAEAQFLKLGIRTIGDLLKVDGRLLRASFGEGYSDHVLALAQGWDERPVQSEHRAKSVGRETTFDDDTRDLGLLRQTLADLAEDVAARLRRHQWTAGQLTVKFRWEGFETHTRQQALRPASAHGPELFAVARKLLKEELDADGRRIRLIGLSAGKIMDQGGETQAELFGPSQERQQSLDVVMDKVHDRFGGEALKRGNQSMDAPRRVRTGFSLRTSMRRCPHCQAANPSSALFCQHCGQGLPPLKRVPLWQLADWWAPEALKAAVLPLGLLLVFRLSLGDWLNGGLQRDESRFISFHLLHGALFGLGLAWARRERSGAEMLRWMLAGLLGGLLAEAGEYWYTYQHVMGGLSFKILDWYNVHGAALFPYYFLQGLRLAGVALPLGVAWLWAQKPRVGPQVLGLLALVLALYLRAFVTGYLLSWSFLASLNARAWATAGLYLLSPLLLLYAWGPRQGPGKEA